MRCTSKEMGYFCSCQGWFQGLVDFATTKYYQLRNKLNGE
jgi:hypothetical protein